MNNESASIRISVRLSGHLRRFGSGQQQLALPRSATVRDALQSLAAASPELRAALLNPAGEPNAQIMIFVDDEQSDAQQVLADGASVTLMLPISGG